MDEIEDNIENINFKVHEKNLPVYYKYRYTFDKEEQDKYTQETMTHQLVRIIRQKIMIGDKIVAGVEHYTKGMLTTKAHVHIHFISRIPADTIRRYIARKFQLKGRCQSCKAEVLVDEPKFWRYPLKQQKEETAVYKLAYGYTTTELDVMTDIAHACWKQSAQVLVDKLEKKLERSAKDRLFVYLDSLELAFESIKQFCIKGYEYFAEHEDTLCIKTVDGYVNIYLLQKKYITAEQLYNLSHS